MKNDHAVEASVQSGPSSTVWAWIGTGVLATAGFVLAPHLLAGNTYGGGIAGSPQLSTAVQHSVIDYLDRGIATTPPAIQQLSRYWSDYHIAKAVFAALVLIASSVVGVRTFRAITSGRTTRTVFVAVSGAAVTIVGVIAALLLAANIQGAVAPRSSLLSLLPPAVPGDSLATTQHRAASDLATGTHNPAVAALAHDFGTYHAVLAAVMAVLVAACLAIAAVSARAFRRTDRRTAARRITAFTAVTFTVITLSLAVLTAANLSNAADPNHALHLFLTGS